MEEYPNSGSLQEYPLPQVLFNLWRSKRTGSLVVLRADEERSLRLLKGLLALDRESLDEAAFLGYLRRHRRLSPARSRRSGEREKIPSGPLLRTLTRPGLLTPEELWICLDSYFLESLVGLFEWPEGRFEFLPSATFDFDLLLAGIPTPDRVLDGVRGMTRLEAAARWLGRDRGPWQATFPAHLGPASLRLHERYVLSLLAEERSLEDVLALSQLDRAETQKILYALACTGAAGPAPARPRPRTPPDFSLSDYDKILAHFKTRTSVIFRYLSKEVGPVALNIVQKALDEVNAWLGPGSPKVSIDPDGSPQVKTLLRGHSGLFREDDPKNLYRILDEILAAEVLMVKRTLGNDHEAALVRALER